jgi:aminopeptidase-like protein
MQPYRNLAGNSGVEAFDILRDGIMVRFVSGGTYLYDYRVPGRKHVEEMKRLARAGRGLSTYISKLGADYAERFD